MQHDTEWSDDESFSGFSSNTERASARVLDPRHSHNDYLLGLKILESCIMRQTFDKLERARDGFDLNVAFADESSRFPYGDCLRHAVEVLGDEYNVNYGVGNHSAGLATLLGMTYRLDAENHTTVLLTIESKSQNATPTRRQMPSIPRALLVHEEGVAGQSVVEDTAQLPRYAMRLNEYALSQGFQIKWEETELSLNPPRFRAASRIQGVTFEGMASNKKTARHIAAKQACMALGIQTTLSGSY